MATREEIQIGTYSIINNRTRGRLSPTERRKLRDALLEYLDSQDVAIKVGGELPDNAVYYPPKQLEAYEAGRQVIIGAGYTAWESLGGVDL